MWVQFSQWCNSIANMKNYKSRSVYFALAVTISKTLTFQNFDFEKVGQSHGPQVLQDCHSMGNIKIYKKSSNAF